MTTRSFSVALIVTASLAVIPSLALVTGCSSSSSTTQASLARKSNGGMTETIHLQHIPAARALAQLQSQHFTAKITADDRTNSLIVTGTAAQQADVRQAIARIDQPG